MILKPKKSRTDKKKRFFLSVKPLLHLQVIFFLTLLVQQQSFAQQTINVQGVVTDTLGRPIENVTVNVLDTKINTLTDKHGRYSVEAPNKDMIIVFRHVGYMVDEKFVTKRTYTNEANSYSLTINTRMQSRNRELESIDIRSSVLRSQNLISLHSKTFNVITDAAGGGVEAVVKTMPGVFSRNELSTQYSVRGGNFDENLVYVNGIEVYRPLLIRSGQQEGLSFVNTDMVSSVLFSNGGFAPKYGDKMSSVLDIKYERPKKFGATISGSLLGASAHIKGISKDSAFTYNTGIRYKSSKYLLNSMETKGDYFPTFTDIQTYLSYRINPGLDLNFLGNYSANKYLFEPTERTSTTGTVDDALNLRILYQGHEIDKFKTFTGALSSDYNISAHTQLKLTFSVFDTREAETFDLDARYSLNRLEQSLGESLGDSTQNIGIGRYLNHARNFLDGRIYSFEHKGLHETELHSWQWGAKYQIENFEDKLNEWMLLDSAGYSIPRDDSELILYSAVCSDNKIKSTKISTFIQDSYKFMINKSFVTIVGGIRATYHDLAEELIISPRMSVSLQPDWNRDVLFRFASGVYYQTPFYKEFRSIDGRLNKGIKSQRSIHFVAGTDYNFRAWNRPFKLVAEMYYKKLDNLIPYQVDNVRIKYYSFEKAKGYATGIDLKINGEFVKDAESWISLSYLRTEEDIQGDGHGYIPRPTDQRFNAGLFFQDYFPNNKTIKMHLTLMFGSGLPFGPTNRPRYMSTSRMPFYKRVDLGFSKMLKSEDKHFEGNNIFNHFKSVWLSFEVFNLLDVNNTVSYLWVTVVPNTTSYGNENYNQYAVPNRLTARMFNLKLISKF